MDETPSTADRIREVALDLFLDRGYVGASMREIAGEVGVSTPALYYHFGSKDDLLAAIVEGLAADGESLLRHLAEVRRSEGFAELALGAYFDLLISHLEVFRFVSTDRAVRSHPVAGHRLARQADTFHSLLSGPRPSRSMTIRAAAAIGAIRRPLRLPSIDRARDRRLVIRAALAALGAR